MRPAMTPRTSGLGHVALSAPDLGRARAHYGDVLGLVETSGSGADTAYFSVGGTHHDVVLRPADNVACLHLSFRLVDGREAEAFAREVRDFGLPAEVQTDPMPGIPSLVEVKAPGGNVMQFYTEEDGAAPGFPTGGVAPIRFSHVAIISPEAPALRRFYEDFLGFHYTDDFEGIATFLTCNRDHHVVNLVNAPQSRVHHIAFELIDNAQHARACDILARAKVPTLRGPARHTAGHNLAGYHRDADGTMIELYTQMDVYVPALGQFEPRPWHEHLPMRPMTRGVTDMTTWETEYAFDLVAA